MSDILSLQTPYVDGDTVTSTNLNDLVKKATFTSAVVDGATTQLSSGAIVVRDGGITEQKLSTAAQAKLLQGAELEIDSSTSALTGGIKTGNIRGDGALDIQSQQSNNTEVASGTSAVSVGVLSTASGQNSTCFGVNNNARQDNSVAVGITQSTLGENAVAIGRDNYAHNGPGSDGSTLPDGGAIAIGSENTATGGGTGNGFAMAIGHDNTVTGDNSSAFGLNCDVSEQESHAFGRDVAISSPYSAELGLWSGSTNRVSGVKLTFSGGVALTCENSASAPTDQSTTGDEDTGELGRSMFTIQRNGDAFTLYFNDGGTIKSLALGSVS